MPYVENEETANETSTPTVIFHNIELFKNHVVTITITEESHPNATFDLNDHMHKLKEFLIGKPEKDQENDHDIQ